MRLRTVELRRISLPLVSPFRTSFGVETTRDILLVRVETDSSHGWGECVAGTAPLYSSEYIDAAQEVIARFLVPRIFQLRVIEARDVAFTLRPIKGHPMAKGALEMAILDAELRAQDRSYSSTLGGVRTEVDCGVSVGIHDDVDELVAAVGAYLEEGYKRIKLKIEPGHDIEPVAAVRARFGSDFLLQVDANTAYTLGDAEHLARLDEYGLLLIEQPLPEDDIRGHAQLAERLETPICLDESITSARAAEDAIAMGACSIVNIKAGRVGGYLEARRVHDVCSELGVPVWCGGMLESGLGRAANVALASLPNFTLPGDTSASDRYYKEDITPPFVLQQGRLKVPQGAGLGVEPVPEILDRVTTAVETLHP